MPSSSSVVAVLLVAALAVTAPVSAAPPIIVWHGLGDYWYCHVSFTLPPRLCALRRRSLRVRACAFVFVAVILPSA